MEEGRKLDRTWLCSVLFLDIVDYSSQSVEVQIAWKRFLNDALAEALQQVAVEDRVIIDTGDGAAICFLGDPEAAMLVSLSLRELVLKRAEKADAGPRVRLGINLGPVKLVRDINGNLNALGDGINIGQRIMSFAEPNEILVSRSYHEVVSRLSEDYRKLFTFGGVRQDKHVREHLVYRLLPPGSAQDSSRTPVEPDAAGTSETSKAQFDESTLQSIEACLVPFTGPIAGHLVRGQSRTAADVSVLCAELAKCLSPKEGGAFLASCRKELAAVDATSSAHHPADAASDVPLKSAEVEWDAEFLKQVEQDLAAYLGPIAKVMVRRAAATRKTRDDLYQSIASQISSERDREAFLATRK
jgi:class 3 adenylate cyclase